MWGNPRPANRMGPFRGSQEERFDPGWNRDYSPPLDSLAQERHTGNFSGRESLPFDIQGLPGILNPQFANREEPAFNFGGRDGPCSDFRGVEGHLHDFVGRDYPPSDFQNRDDTHLDFRGRLPLLPDFRGREVYPADFPDREGQSIDYSGGDIPPMDYRNRDAFRMNYRDREAHSLNYRDRDDVPSDFRGRGTFDLDFRSRDSSHPHFRARDMSEQDYRAREQPYSDFRKRDLPDMDLRNMGAADLDFRDRDVPHFRNRPKSQADQDFRGRDVPPPMNFTDREVPSVDPNVVDFQHSQPSVTKRECKIEEAVHIVRERSSLAEEEFLHPEPRAREEVSQGQNLETESSLESQNSCGPLPTLQDQDKPSQTFVSNQEFSGGEQQISETSGLGLKEKDDLDFLGRQDTDYRGIEYRDVDHRLPGNQIFDYEHGKSFAEGKSCKDSPAELQDQDYRTCLKDIKPSKLIRLGRVPETATKDDILNAFQACDGTPVKDLRLKDYTSDRLSALEKKGADSSPGGESTVLEASAPATPAAAALEPARFPDGNLGGVDPAVPARVLICGHSIVFWASKRAGTSSIGSQLGLGRCATLFWLGKRDMQWAQLLPTVREFLGSEPVPDIMVLQLGENDLVHGSCLALTFRIIADLQTIKTWIPGLRLIWSDMLQRRVWTGARAPARIDRARRKVNREVAKFVLQGGGGLITHPEIVYQSVQLFEEDGVHLSIIGADAYLQALRQGLLAFLEPGVGQEG